MIKQEILPKHNFMKGKADKESDKMASWMTKQASFFPKDPMLSIASLS